jgi:hypothetical protein
MIVGMKLSVVGLGMAAKLGKTADIARLLSEDRIVVPRNLAAEHTVAIEIPNDFKIAPQLVRRMSHFAKLSLASTCDAFHDSGLDPVGKAIGIIQGSVYGPIVSGIQALDELVDFGDNQLSPTNFSGSVFNTAATYLSLAFGIQGCSLTHTGGLDTLYNSLLTAALWLEKGTVDYVIAGIGDEYTAFFDQKEPEQSGKPNSFLPTCEGWTTLILGKTQSAKYGQLEFGCLPTLPETKNHPNIYSLWHERSQAERFLDHARNNRACFPVGLRGSYPGAAAFDLGLALICAKNGRFPVGQTAEGIYQVQDLDQARQVSCFSVAEDGGVHWYRV